MKRFGNLFEQVCSMDNLRLAPKVLRIVISNPTDERLEYEGYKKVIETDQPEYDPETQRIESHYVEDGDHILQVWMWWICLLKRWKNQNSIWRL